MLKFFGFFTYLWFCVSMCTYSFCGILCLDCFENKISNPIQILYLTIDKHVTCIYHLFLLHVYKTKRVPPSPIGL